MKKEKKPGKDYYAKEGYSKGVLLFLKEGTHRKLVKLSKAKGKPLQRYLRNIIERAVKSRG